MDVPREIKTDADSGRRFSVRELSGPNDLVKFSALLDVAFQLPTGSHYLEDFPIWAIEKSKERGVTRYGAFLGSGELVASVGMRLGRLRVEQGGTLKVALMGAVATSPQFRGQGLATLLVSHALKDARERDAAAALLWGGEHSLYEKLGFGLCGEQVTVPLQSIDFNAWNFGKEKLERGWVPGLFSKLCSRDLGLVHEAIDRDWLEAHRHTEWYWVGSAESPRAYAAVGRGIDLVGMVHEWGGDRHSLLSILRSLQASRPELTLLGPSSLLMKYGLMTFAAKREYLFLANILDPVIVSSLPRSDGLFCPNYSPKELATRFFGEPDNVDRAQASVWIWGLDAV